MSDREKRISLLAESLPLAVADAGDGQTYLVLHGGAGPGSMMGLAQQLAQHGRAVVPTCPGFNAEPRPEWFATVGDLALAFLALLERRNLSKVVLVGNSFGGWIAAEMALRHSPRIAGVVLLNGVGIDTGSPEKKIVDPSTVPPAERSALSFHDPSKGFPPPSPDQLAVIVENQKTMRLYAGGPALFDPNLRARLGGISVPVLVAWGTSDRIVDADHGRLWAQSIPGARFHAIAEAGHFPHLEQPERVLGLIEDFGAGL